jgi:hypothetical protein
VAFTEDIAPFFADFGGAATLNSVAVTAIVDTQTVIEVDGGVATQQPTALVRTSEASVAAPGQSFVANAVTYIVRQVLREPPDGVLTRLVLARA